VCVSTVVLPRFCRVFTHLCICLPVMATERVTSVISSFQRWLIASPIVPASTYGSATIDANGFVYKLFLAFRFSDTDVGCQFLTQLGLLRVPYCAVSARTKCLGASPIIVTTVSDGHVGGSRLLRHVLLSQQSGTDHGFRRVTSLSWRLISLRTTTFAAQIPILSNKRVSSAPQPFLIGPNSVEKQCSTMCRAALKRS